MTEWAARAVDALPEPLLVGLVLQTLLLVLTLLAYAFVALAMWTDD